jgi:hypothetical protein
MSNFPTGSKSHFAMPMNTMCPLSRKKIETDVAHQTTPAAKVRLLEALFGCGPKPWSAKKTDGNDCLVARAKSQI